MRIVIDLSAAGGDTSDFDAATAQAHAAIRRNAGHDVFIAAHASSDAEALALRAAFAAVLPPENIRTWRALDPGGDPWRSAAADLVREAFLAGLAADEIITLNGDSRKPPQPAPPDRRLRLAYVSPLPPERSGIADYSADLLPELAHWYDIDVVVDQATVTTPWIVKHCGVVGIDAFRAARDRYDRVLYHFGNSPFHRRMFDLLEETPGVAVLHDYYLGDVIRYREVHGLEPHAWTRELYRSAGYGAVAERYSGDDPAAVIARYPVNFSVLRDALGMITHNDYSRRLAAQAYGEDIVADWRRIPLLRVIDENPPDRAAARRELGLADDAFLVCSFGMLGPTKLNLELLQAWSASDLAREPGGMLIFVGENHPGDYGQAMRKAVNACASADRIRITGWTDPADYRRYLAAADVAVQLRGASRGETSAAVMDCLGYGLATVVNADGSAAELPEDAALLLPAVFSVAELTGALEDLRRDGKRRARLASQGKALTATVHAPAACARLYMEAIEGFYAGGRGSPLHEQRLIADLTALPGRPPDEEALIDLAAAVADSLPRRRPGRQVLVDVSAVCRSDLQTGIQRVVRALTLALLKQPPDGRRIEPVSLSDIGGVWHYRYARRWTSRLLGVPDDRLSDDAAELRPGDILLGADFIGDMAVQADQAGVFSRLRAAGVGVHFIVYDLLPILLPQAFPPGQFGFSEWLQVIGRQADGVMCISRAVAADVERWAANMQAAADRPARRQPLRVGWFHLGDDLENSSPSQGRPPDADALSAAFSARPSFLMVGTIEPRKGHLQTLAAFDLLWKAGAEVNLVVAGREGWRGMPDAMRRTIPEIIARLRGHPERGRRLFWLDDASDEFLEEVYAASACLIAASDGEGFGLPLVEAARRSLPILARDLPVFQEVAGPHAAYFSGPAPEDLAAAVENWLVQRRDGQAPASSGMPRRSWSQSARQLLEGVLSPGTIHTAAQMK
jgi:glycosyltransferase involved in cell wall biosynthesis